MCSDVCVCVCVCVCVLGIQYGLCVFYMKPYINNCNCIMLDYRNNVAEQASLQTTSVSTVSDISDIPMFR